MAIQKKAKPTQVRPKETAVIEPEIAEAPVPEEVVPSRVPEEAAVITVQETTQEEIEQLPAQCPMCGAKFYVLSNLRKHQQQH